jgi:hypothetical protein
MTYRQSPEEENVYEYFKGISSESIKQNPLEAMEIPHDSKLEEMFYILQVILLYFFKELTSLLW